MSAYDKPSQQPLQYVLSANELLSGDVVFRNANGGWSTGVDAAVIYPTQDLGFVALADAHNDERANIIFAPVLIEVLLEDGAPRPAHIRERIRALGPTVRPDLARSARGFSLETVEKVP